MLLDRVENCVNSMGLEIDEARKMIVAVDEARDYYHMNYDVFYYIYFGGYMLGDIYLCVFLSYSSLLGVENTAKYLAELVREKLIIYNNCK